MKRLENVLIVIDLGLFSKISTKDRTVYKMFPSEILLNKAFINLRTSAFSGLKNFGGTLLGGKFDSGILFYTSLLFSASASIFCTIDSFFCFFSGFLDSLMTFLFYFLAAFTFDEIPSKKENKSLSNPMLEAILSYFFDFDPLIFSFYSYIAILSSSECDCRLYYSSISEGTSSISKFYSSIKLSSPYTS